MVNGTYLLFITLHSPKRVQVGSLGTIDIVAGEYCYVGSAMNGLRHRIKRHMSSEKKTRWHIDRLTLLADHMEAFVSLDPIHECVLADIAEKSGCTQAFKGFGSSDCRCRTHLFIVDNMSKQELLKASGTVPFLHEPAV